MKKITQLMHRLLHGTTPISDVASIRRLGRDEYEYEESGKRTTVQVEMLSGEPSRIIYASTIKSWLPPPTTWNRCLPLIETALQHQLSGILSLGE